MTFGIARAGTLAAHFFGRTASNTKMDSRKSRSILSAMSGINFIVDERGKKKSVVIDLDLHANLWEDFYDALIVRSRREEPRESLAEVERRLSKSRGG
jgi:hypothetical protein